MTPENKARLEGYRAKQTGSLSQADKARLASYRTKYEPEPAVVEPPTDWAHYPKLIAKSLATGALSPLELAKLPQQAIMAGLNYLTPEGMRHIDPKYKQVLANYGIRPEPVSYVEQLQERLRPDPKTQGEQLASTAAEFVGGSLGGIGGGVTNSAKMLGKAAGVGLTSGTLQNAEVNPILADIGASIALPVASKIGVRGAGRLAAKGLGLSPAKLVKEAPMLEAAKRMNIDLPLSAMTDRPITNYVEHAIKKSPWTNSYARKADNTKHVLNDELADIINRVGLPNTPENQAIKRSKYEALDDLLPHDAMIDTQNTQEAAVNVGQKWGGGLSRSQGERNKILKLAAELESKTMPNQFANPEFRATHPVLSVEDLLAEKRALNGLLYPEKANTPGLIGTAGLKELRKGIHGDIERYGSNLNPDWHKSLLEADQMHAGMKMRDQLDTLLENVKMADGDMYSPAKLAKQFSKPTKSKVIADSIAKGTRSTKKQKVQDLRKIDDVASIAKGLYREQVRNPNPSGTTAFKTALDSMGTVAQGGAVGLGALLTPIGGNALLSSDAIKGNAIKRALGIPIEYNWDNIARHTPMLTSRAMRNSPLDQYRGSYDDDR